MAESSLADVCVIAAAEAFRGDGEIFASGMGTVPILASRLARASFEPDLLVSDAEAYFVANDLPLGAPPEVKVIEGWIPFRSVFDTLWSGRRHVMMGATQIDRWGNQNFAAVGDYTRPKAQLLGFRGAPGNTVNDPTSYWIPAHSPRVLVERVDVVTGVGWDRAAAAGPAATAHMDLRAVVTNLAVLDFRTDDHRLRLASVHPGVTVDEVVAATEPPLITD